MLLTSQYDEALIAVYILTQKHAQISRIVNVDVASAISEAARVLITFCNARRAGK